MSSTTTRANPNARRGHVLGISDARAHRRRLLAAVVEAVRVIRPLAWVLLGGGALLAVLGLAWRWGELVVIAVVIAVVVLLSLLFLLGRTAYDVHLELARNRVVVGERAYGSLRLVNGTARSIPASRVVLPVGSGRGAFDVPRLAPGDERDELFSVPTHARGVLRIGPVSVLRGDPLGLFERIDSRRDVQELYVHPRTVILAGLSLGSIRDLEGLPTTDLADDDVSFHALREYQPGDDLRHVHWRSTARTGQVMIRQYEQTRRSNYMLGLSTHPADYADPEQFELAVSIAGSIGVRALTDSLQLQAYVPGRTLRTDSPRGFLDELSGVELTRTRGADLPALGAAMAKQSDAVALAVIVCGAEASAAALQTAWARIPQGTRVLAITAEVGAATVLRRVGDAEVLTIGSLDDLALALRRVLA